MKCIKCGKKGFFLKTNKDGLCKDCEEKIQIENKNIAKHTYDILVNAFKPVKQSMKNNDCDDISLLDKYINECDIFISKRNEVTYITNELKELFILNSSKSYFGLYLKDFDAHTDRNDHLEDINVTLNNLSDRVARHRERIIERKKDIINFSNMLNKIPRYSITIDKELAKKRNVSELIDITYSNITKRSSKEKLGNFVVLDTETTGLSAGKDEIIEICAIKFRDFKPIECFETLCKPKKPIPEDATAINGITNGMVENHPHFRQIVNSLTDFIGNENIIGHNLEFDLKFLVKQGLDVTTSNRKYFDTLELSKKTFKQIKSKWDREYNEYVLDYDSDYDVENYKLGTLCNYCEIPLIGAHRALADCYATGLLFEDIVERKINL